MDHFLVADEERVEETVQRLAHRVFAGIDAVPVVIGIRRRGVPLARRLAERLTVHYGWESSLGEVKLKRYADDLTLLHRQPKLAEESLSVDVDGAEVVLVDDVLYTGRTLLRAAQFLLEAGAEHVYSTVLCARDEPEVPVTANFTGMRLDVGSENLIELHIPPYEEDTAVILQRREDA